MLTGDQSSSLTNQAAPAACDVERKGGPPAELTVAQWAIESGWGAHAPENNCFGIKAYSGCHGRQLLPTYEWFTGKEAEAFLHAGDSRTLSLVEPLQERPDGRKKYHARDWFATFSSLADAFAYYQGKLLTDRRYAPALSRYRDDRDLPALIRSIAPFYATDPGYADKLIAITSMDVVRAAIQHARNGGSRS